jgi:hypothetical protein
VKATKLPETLMYFACDTSGVHAFSGPIVTEWDEKRVREHYPAKTPSVTRMRIGHYKLVSIEEVEVERRGDYL